MSRSLGAVLKLEGIIGKESEKAIQFTIHRDGTGEPDETCWFPLSQVLEIHREGSAYKGTLDSIVVSMWIAKQKNLIEVD